MKILTSILWAIFITSIIFLSIFIQDGVNREIDNRADERLKGSWCNVDFGSSSATVECEKIERLKHETND